LVLKKPIKQRTPKEIELVKKYTEHVAFFKNIRQELGPEALGEICANLEYTYLEKEKVLFEQGKFRIIRE
jgi:hypothetical protein